MNALSHRTLRDSYSRRARPRAQAAEISGAGATFPYPIYAKWAEAYEAKTGLKMNYQSIGSGGGIKQITAKTVDFGASDMPLKPADSRKGRPHAISDGHGRRGAGGQSSGHPTGSAEARRPDLADIYLGKITKWNDPAIASSIPG